MVIKSIALAVVFLGLAACTMGPDFIPPDIATPSSWFRSAPPVAKSQLSEREPVDVEWWTVLNDPLLNKLVSRAAAQNIDVQAATARLGESRAQRSITASDFYPQLNGDASYDREKLSDKGVISLVSGGGAGSSSATSGGGGGAAMGGIPSTAASPAFNVYQYGFDVSWEIDLWGRVRRGVESADANVEASKEARRGLLLSSVAELVRDYVQLRGTQASLATVREEFKAACGIVDLANERSKAGLSNEIDIANARAQAATTGGQIPQLEQQEAMLKNALALLLALPPGALEVDLSEAVPIPPIPPVVPIGLPSDLARRRPDIRQAVAQLHAATADIGVAEADFFPKLTLMGNGMLQSLDFSTLNSWAARSYTFGPSISLPLFEGGRLSSTLELRNQSQREAALNYQKILLTALHEVDNALTAYRAEQQREISIAVAVEQNRKALSLATDRYKQGLGDFVTVLTDEQNLLSSEEQNISSNETESVNMVQLYKALGGGWQTSFPDATGQPQK